MKFKLFDSEDFGVTSQPASESVDSAGISLRQVPADMLVTSTPTSQCNASESVTAVACAKCQWPQRSAGTAVPVCLVVTTSTVTAKTKTTLALAVAL